MRYAAWMRVQSLTMTRPKEAQWRTGSLESDGGRAAPIRKSLVYNKEPCSRCRKYAVNAPKWSIDCPVTRYFRQISSARSSARDLPSRRLVRRAISFQRNPLLPKLALRRKHCFVTLKFTCVTFIRISDRLNTHSALT